jgi:hypothetical protein
VMLSCKEAIRLASEALDRPLTLRARIGLRMHLLLCSACRAAARQMRALDSLIGRRFARDPEPDATSPQVDPAARERVREAVHSALDQGE